MRYTNGAQFTIAPEVLKGGEAIDCPSLPVDRLTHLRCWRRAHTASYAYIPKPFAQTWRYNCSRLQRDTFVFICIS